jgi:hypothetical protein
MSVGVHKWVEIIFNLTRIYVIWGVELDDIP